jgi:UDP-2,3-diacylglucosamine hydrolase
LKKKIQAPLSWHRIDFISDVHLDASTSATWHAFATHLMQTPAQAVFLLGDIAEAWIGDDAAQVPGFERDFLQLLAQAAQKRYIGFLAGNRDFLLGWPQFDADIPVDRLADVCELHAFDACWLLLHGDAECIGDIEYQRVRRLLRDPDWQQKFLAQSIAERRLFAQQARQQSIQAQRHMSETPTSASSSFIDLDDAVVLDLLRQANSTTVIHGHTHRPRTHDLPHGEKRWVLSDWDLNAHPPRAEVLVLTGEGLSRQPPTT